MKKYHLREPARILFHLDHGYTKISLERTEGKGLAYGGAEWDIPTASIPPYLRKIGARFIIITDTITPEENDSVEDIRKEQLIRVENGFCVRVINTFTLIGRGLIVVVSPWGIDRYPALGEIGSAKTNKVRVEIHRPDGTSLRLYGSLEGISPNVFGSATINLGDIDQKEVPIGSQIWSCEESKD